MLLTPLLQTIAVPFGMGIGADLEGTEVLLTIFKYGLWVGSFLYTIFAVVVVRQIAVMKRTLITSFSPIFTLVGWIHLIVSVCVFLMFIMIL